VSDPPISGDRAVEIIADQLGRRVATMSGYPTWQRAVAWYIVEALEQDGFTFRHQRGDLRAALAESSEGSA
jgi:hypothetical protein